MGETESSREFLRRMDWFLLTCLAGVIFFGVVFVGSAASGDRALFVKHLVWTACGAVGILIAARVDYMRFVRHAYTIYGTCLVALALVFFTRPVNNATSWFDLGFMKVQPAEFAKLALVLALARCLSEDDWHRSFSGLAVPLAITGVPAALILKQPDLGTALVFFPVCFVMLYAAGARLRHLGAFAAAGFAGAVFMYFFMLHEYQRNRIRAWLDPTEYRARDAFQLLQSRIAMGSGGFLGKGVGLGTQHKLGYVPVQESDFIFSVIGEESGFVGAAALLVLMLLVFAAGLSIAERTREPEGRMVALGMVALLAVQSFINMAVAVGLLPTTGVTLPFVSYGGSSMLTSCVAVGMLLSVATHPHWMLTRDQFAD